MSTNDKRQRTRRVVPGAIKRARKRKMMRIGLDQLLFGESPTRLGSPAEARSNPVGPDVPQRGTWVSTATTPHSWKSPAIATVGRNSNGYGLRPVTHPVIVVTGDEPAVLEDAVSALRSYRNPLDAVILASLMSGPADRDKPKQPGGSGTIPQTQTLVFSRPDRSGDLRIRVVPISALTAPQIPQADLLRTMAYFDRDNSSKSKPPASRWLSGL
jgi:hypothetical protein